MKKDDTTFNDRTIDDLIDRQIQQESSSVEEPQIKEEEIIVPPLLIQQEEPLKAQSQSENENFSQNSNYDMNKIILDDKGLLHAGGQWITQQSEIS